ncbi:class D sortase [Bacillus cytotoxicus]|uniref:class D sortase n=1 Tax=unclassified Bacillus cereus group TaxID=2750818 RepID=UPI001F58F83D|nr:MULTISPECIES: class D sortase [unclassified Bacillus cereus group]EMA6342364.1 class D sortase [Bacillus cytotoxicus]
MNKGQWFGLCLIVIGLSTGSFCFIEWYSAKNSAHSLTEYEVKQYKEFEHIPRQQNLEKTLLKIQTEQVSSSQSQHQFGEKIAQLIVPKLKKKYSIYWGTDEKVLKKGVGMFVSDLTTTPSGKGHTVLSGHRDTVFIEIGKLKENDTLILKYDKKTYTYQISRHWITRAEDRTVVVPKNRPTLTLTTCYPFEYIGNAPDRYIIEANLLSII